MDWQTALAVDLPVPQVPVHAMARQFETHPPADTEGEIAVLRLTVTQLEERIEALEIREELAERRDDLAANRLSARMTALEEAAKG